MEFSIDVTHVGAIGDKSVKLMVNDENITQTVNMYLNNEHYRVNLDELQKLLSVLKMSKY